MGVEGEKKNIYIKWMGAAWNLNQSRCSFLPKSEGRTSLDPPTAPSSGPSLSHPPFPRPRLRLAGA